MSWVITGSEKTPVDPQFGSVSLLLHGDGTNGSTTITDSSPTPKTVTRTGATQISIDESKFGGSSVKFNQTGYLRVTQDVQIQAAQNFTIELWANLATTQVAGATLFEFGQYSNGILLRFSGDGFYVNSPLGAVSYTANVWQHWAVVRNGTQVHLYRDGASINSTINSAALNTANQPLTIGDSTHSTGSYPLNGYIDDLRITKGVARYTANFTPPTAPFPDI
jgi:hypothetical protein